MSNIAKAFANGKAFIPFVTCGDPDLETTAKVVRAMAQAFPGGRLCFDAAGRSAVKLMLKTWIKTASIQDVGAYFSVSDAKAELSIWSPLLRVSSRGYMLGYNNLRAPAVSGFFRFLARVGDGMMKMQIVQLTFDKPQGGDPA